ncbi:hydrogen peroxide-inducible genes activator [Aquibium sp. A9E412]|uniref:hydrogen peroxide-inducible genes activator n=1 Tax=Aquibium sp. A9E412 TaxID=2976767 RepID=UPI0025AF3F7A|nr:hydrogen peroxide-inducible genes activator [Aquibium sp. A9E412]MDN2567030.1 hydrogen peroxide-inducible genes activator [Aquibium sp. A9E412]
MPTLRQLSYLVALAEERHFRRAAERVHVSQPTLSTQLQELERRLKAPLIERPSSRVALTPLGRDIAERARRVLAEVQDIVDLAAASQHGLSGTLRLGVPPTLGPYLLPHILPRLQARHPELKFYVREGKPHALQSDLQGGYYDLVVSPLPVTQADLAVERLFREPLLVVAARNHPLAGRQRIDRSDLAGQKVLAIEPGHHLHEQVRALCDELGATLLRDYEGTSLDTLRQMAGMGFGLAFLPALYVRSEIGARGEVAVIALEGRSLSRQIGLLWRRRSVHAERFAALAGVIRALAGQHLPEVTVTG